MGERDLIVLIARLFKKHKISYILTGSFAGSYWGRPRATHDIDFLVEVKISEKAEILAILQSLGRDFIIDFSEAEKAMDQCDQFNIKSMSLNLSFGV